MHLGHRRDARRRAAWLVAALAATPAWGQNVGDTMSVPPRQTRIKAPQAGIAVPFRNSPYPVPPDLTVPGTGERFFTGEDAGGRFHMSPRGGKYRENATYADPRSLVVVPSRFDPARPAALVIFFHGNLATLARDVVARQKVVAQFEASGLNALMVAPQLAVDALDSSPGRFYQPGFLDTYVEEAAEHLAEASGGRFAAAAVQSLPLILVAYSGGYLATAFCLSSPSAARERVRGVVLLDALFGEESKFADWIAAAHSRAFFVSAYTPASAGLNMTLAADLAKEGVVVHQDLPRELLPGDVVMRPVLGAVHNDFVTQAWTRDPLRALLSRIQLGSR